MSPVPAINHGSGQCTKAKAVAEIRMQPKVAKKWRNRRSWKQRRPFPYNLVLCPPIANLRDSQYHISGEMWHHRLKDAQWHSLNLSESNQHHQRKAAVILYCALITAGVEPCDNVSQKKGFFIWIPDTFQVIYLPHSNCFTQKQHLHLEESTKNGAFIGTSDAPTQMSHQEGL